MMIHSGTDYHHGDSSEDSDDEMNDTLADLNARQQSLKYANLTGKPIGKFDSDSESEDKKPIGSFTDSDSDSAEPSEAATEDENHADSEDEEIALEPQTEFCVIGMHFCRFAINNSFTDSLLSVFRSFNVTIRCRPLFPKEKVSLSVFGEYVGISDDSHHLTLLLFSI